MAQKVHVTDPTTQLIKELEPNTTSAGAGDAGKLVALDGGGKLDSTLFPAGMGEASQIFPANENLAGGNLVNIYDVSGTATARKADATDATKPAHGFVLAAVTTPADATVYFPGQIVTGASGLVAGAAVFLSASSPGGVSSVAPSAAGNLVQQVGTALSASSFVFQPLLGIIKG